jgi:septum formation protein
MDAVNEIVPGGGSPEIVLASGSPRRRELLEKLGVRFRVRAADIDEASTETDPERLVRHLALEKAKAVSELEPGSVILAADTTVSLDKKILNKPASILENIEFISHLSGNWHEVFTGVSFVWGDQRVVGAECTRVKFKALSKMEIEGYAKSGEGLDKAGGYGIQERGMALIERIDGDYFNVVGLPIFRMLSLAHEINLELLPWLSETKS